MSPTLTSITSLISTALAVASGSATPFDPGFNISAVATLAQSLPSHSWEYGTAAQTLLELNTPVYSVFGDSPFPVPALSPDDIPSLAYAMEKIVLGTGANGLSDGAGAVGDPASLGVAAVMLGKTNASFAAAAQSEIDYIVGTAPRWPNGAISQRSDVAELCIRGVLGGVDAAGNPHVTSEGIVTPAVNPLGWSDTAPWTAGSPEGNNFVVLMYAAWRDCIYAGRPLAHVNARYIVHNQREIMPDAALLSFSGQSSKDVSSLQEYSRGFEDKQFPYMVGGGGGRRVIENASGKHTCLQGTT
ncbi:hypothetical protein C8R44DRAFT_731133 [Mycena epipterygia]|nr:hypothetical protein C8R44DRAFT_731133 [Mycena epipterygia]